MKPGRCVGLQSAEPSFHHVSIRYLSETSARKKNSNAVQNTTPENQHDCTPDAMTASLSLKTATTGMSH